MKKIIFCFCGPSEIIDRKKLAILTKVKDLVSILYGIITALETKYDRDILIDKSKKYSIDNIDNYYIKIFNNFNKNIN